MLQAKLLQGGSGAGLDQILGLQDAATTATKLVQYVRSVKGVTSVLVGHKVRLRAGLC